MKFHFITAVWGKEYTKNYLDVTLPSQITPGNLLAFQGKGSGVYKIYTTSEFAVEIKVDRRFKQVCEIMPTEIVMVDHIFEDPESSDANVYELMTKCHNMAIDDANKEDAYLIFLSPDAIWSDGSFALANKIACTGKLVIMMCSFRLLKETFVPEYKQEFAGADGCFVSPPRPLVRLALKHLHPATKSCFIDSKIFSGHSTHLYWPVGKSGIVARALHMHPFMIKSQNKKARIKFSSDSDYVLKACPDYKDYYVVTDSDEMVAFEFSAENRLAELTDKSKVISQFDFCKFVSFAGQHGHRIHRRLLGEKIRFHSEEMSDEWKGVEKASDKIIKRTLMLLALMENGCADYLPKFVDANSVSKVVIFGCGSGGRQAYGYARKLGWEILYFVDNSNENWGEGEFGIDVKSPDALFDGNFDLVIVASMPGKVAIFNQLDEMGFAYKYDYAYFMDHMWMGDYSSALKPRVKTQVK